MNLKILEYEKENEKIKQNLLNEINKNKNLNDMLLQRDEQIKNINKNYEDILNKQLNLKDEIIKRKNDIENYAIHCKSLKEQNDKLMNEINNTVSFNQKFKNILNRKEKISSLIEENKSVLKNSLKNVEIDFDKDIE